MLPEAERSYAPLSPTTSMNLSEVAPEAQVRRSYWIHPLPARITQAQRYSHPAQLCTMDIRLLRPSDIPQVQQTNITNLPENYFCKYYMYHALSWPQLSYVAVDVRYGQNKLQPMRKAVLTGYIANT